MTITPTPYALTMTFARYSETIFERVVCTKIHLAALFNPAPGKFQRAKAFIQRVGGLVLQIQQVYSARNKDISLPLSLAVKVELFKRGCFDFITCKDGKRHEKQGQALAILTDNDHVEVLYGGAAGGALIPHDR